MTEQQLEVITRILNENIEKNKDYVALAPNLAPTVIESINTESAICAEGVNFLNTIHRYLQKWETQLKIDGVNSKSMVLNDIKFLLKKN